MELSVIIVSYNTRSVLRNCLGSVIKNTKGLDYEIIVVDNASCDGSADMLKKEFPTAKLICNRDNLGFAKANNQGIKIAKGENVLLLNSDTIVFDNCLYKTLGFAKSKPDSGVVGCRVLNEDKTLQYSCCHNPTLLTELMLFSKIIIKDFWEPITHYKFMKYWDHNNLREVDCVFGCFLWIKRDVFNQIGVLDEDFFMYYEDLEFCRRVREKSNYRIYYYPGTGIIHLGSMSTTSHNYSVVGNYYRSAVCYFDKCSGKSTVLLFKILCKSAWNLEMFIFSGMRWNGRFRNKLYMLKKLSSL